MTWGNDHHGKTTFGRWENRLLDAYTGDIDDLTDAVCARCGTDAFLHRPVGLEVDGDWCGEIVCEDCVTIIEGDDK